MKNKLYYITLFLVAYSYSVHAQDTNQSLTEIISKKREFNENSKNGFCIQLYNGNEKTAIKKIEEFRELFPEVKVKRIYKVPEWKIQTTTFKTRLEADRVLNKIRDEYPGARVL